MTTRSRYTFFLMFSIFMLLNLNFTVLRSIRSTLAVVDLGSGAHTLPLFELFGTMPAAFLMTWGLASLMNRFSIEKVFLLTLSIFLGFFGVFATLIYPFLPALKVSGEVGNSIVQVCTMLFYVMSELWKPALAIILLWGLINQYCPVLEAKKLYAPLMLGGSLGSMLASPLISMCTSEKIWKWLPLSSTHWTHSFNFMMVLLVLIGIISGIFYYQLWKIFTCNSQKNEIINDKTEDISLTESLSVCTKSKQLRLLSWMVIADYIAYSLGEVIFLEVLKLQFPFPSDYCNYMGYLGLGSGLLTFISSLLITPFVLQHCRWVVASLVTPICLLITEGLFFFFVRGKSLSSSWFGWNETEWVAVVVLLGSIQYCVCRGAKYTFFDASKEVAFVLMPDNERMKGKLIIDGLCARLGRGSASMMSIILIKVSGGVIASSLATGIIAIGLGVSWVISTCKLGKQIDTNKFYVQNAEGAVERLKPYV